MSHIDKDNPEDTHKPAKRREILIWFLFAVLVLIPSIVWAVVVMIATVHRVRYFPITPFIIIGIAIAFLPIAICVVAIRRKAIATVTAVAVFGILALLVLNHIDTTRMRVSSPDSQFEVLIRHPLLRQLDSDGLNVWLCDSRVCDKLYDLQKEIPSADFHLGLVQVAWCDSPRSVAILVTGNMPALKFASRLPERSPIHFATVQRCIEDAIRKEYNLADDLLDRRGQPVDPIFWAATDGHAAFRRKHPKYFSIWTPPYRR